MTDLKSVEQNCSCGFESRSGYIQTKQTTVEDKIVEAQYNFIKLLVCMQASVELFDEVEGTKFYRHDLKRVINGTRTKLIAALNGTYGFIDTSEKEETFQSIERAVHEILDTSVEELFKKGYKPLIQKL